MEFSYILSEKEYLRAVKLACKAASRSIIKMVLFWVFVLVCLMLLFAVYQKNKQRQGLSDQPDVTQPAVGDSEHTGSTTHDLLWNVGPFILLGGVWIVSWLWLQPMRLRRIYRKDPFMQGRSTVDITPESISIRNTAGTSSQTGWNVYDSWREGKDLIILVHHSRVCSVLSLTELPESQRDELRAILTTALPKK
jgi:hypothetical protein